MGSESPTAIATQIQLTRQLPMLGAVGIFGLAMLVGSTAHAQESLGRQSIVQNSSSSVSDGTATDEIIVTALRSETAASQTPVTLTAINGAALRNAGVMDVSTLDELVPNM